MQNLKCPNCGATLAFEDNAYEIKCNSCKRSFLIERNIPQNMQVEYKLVPRVVDKNIGVGTIIKIVAFCVAIILLVPVIIIIKNKTEIMISREQNSNYVANGKEFFFEDVSSYDLDNLKSISYEEINNKNSNNACITIKDYEYVGSYLYKSFNKY